MAKKTIIEIGCPPGNPRPDDLFPDVLKDTGLTPDDFTLVAKVFGDFTWELKDESKSGLYAKARDVIGKRLDKLYSKGTIRYASW